MYTLYLWGINSNIFKKRGGYGEIQEGEDRQ